MKTQTLYNPAAEWYYCHKRLEILALNVDPEPNQSWTFNQNLCLKWKILAPDSWL